MDSEAPDAMASMFERGRLGFSAYLDALPALARPIGGATMAIILHADFVANIETVIEHVKRTHSAVYVLDEDNDLACFMAPFSWRR